MSNYYKQNILYIFIICSPIANVYIFYARYVNFVENKNE